MIRQIALSMLLVIVTGCATLPASQSKMFEDAISGPRVLKVETGNASWYGPGFHGRKTANGETYNMYAMTAAHKTLPLGSIVRVTNLKNGKKVIVRINDRGPYIDGRIIDLSKAAMIKIDGYYDGVVPVKVEVLRLGNGT